jgi:hypothetical protein
VKQVTFYFDSIESATEALLLVFIEARLADSVFRFSGLTAEQLFRSGLRLDGDIETVARKIDQIAGVVREEDEETSRG